MPTFIYATDLLQLGIASLVIWVVLVMAMYVCGSWMTSRQFRIGYSRKLVHLSSLIVPLAVFHAIGIVSVLEKLACISASSLALSLSLTRIARKSIRVLEVSFSSIDRPEDRPHTLILLTSQMFCAYAVLFASALVYRWLGIDESLLVLSVVGPALADGAAEPVGMQFGLLRYRVPSFVVQQSHYRTIGGSAAVFVVSSICCFAYRAEFSPSQFTVLLIVVPIALTLVEAASPHSWDAPLMYLMSATIVAVITTCV
jgi:phytol kinase